MWKLFGVLRVANYTVQTIDIYIYIYRFLRPPLTTHVSNIFLTAVSKGRLPRAPMAALLENLLVVVSGLL